MLYLYIGGIEVGAEDYLSLGREHRLRQDLRQQGVVLRLERTLESGRQQSLGEAVE